MAAPVVSVVTPRRGTSAGAVPVVIQGSWFTGATAVDFGFTSAITFTVIDDNTISASTPVYPMVDGDDNSVTQIVVDVIVTTPHGSNALGVGDLFEFTTPADTSPVDPLDPLSNLRLLIGERIPAGRTDSDTMFEDAELTSMILRHNNNLYLAASEAWSAKAAEFASLVDVSESGSQRQLSQLFRQANQMSQTYNQAGQAFWRSTIERPVGKSASILRSGVGGPNEGPALGVAAMVDPSFDPWLSGTARFWPLITVMIG